MLFKRNEIEKPKHSELPLIISQVLTKIDEHKERIACLRKEGRKEIETPNDAARWGGRTFDAIKELRDYLTQSIDEILTLIPDKDKRFFLKMQLEAALQKFDFTAFKEYINKIFLPKKNS